MRKIIRANLSDNSIKIEQSPSKWEMLSGRALTSTIIADEVNPTCDALGVNNKIVIAPGLLAGTTVSCVNRISIGGKSPLTGTIKESNAGGTTAYKLGRLGIKAVVIEGKPKNDVLNILYISDDKVELIPSEDLRNLGAYDTASVLKERYGSKIGTIIIGPAGERLYLASGITNSDIDGMPSRYCGRGGLGAVMGSKRIKAIVIDDSKGKAPEAFDKELFKKTRDEITHTILNNEIVANSYTKYGTAGLVTMINSMGALPTRNFSTGYFEGADEISGQKLYDLITTRKGEGNPSHACMPGCLIKCSNIFPDENGKAVVAPLEFETIGLMGSNCGIASLDTIAKLNYYCNDMGIDTIDTGAAIGVAMEAGIIPFGDGEGALGLLNEVKNNTPIGRIIGSGALVAGKVLGVSRIPVCKGQAMPAYDPRGIKGLGVTYATSTMGADHTAGQTLRAQVEHKKPDKQVETSRNAQITNTLHDYIGTCFFVGGAIRGNLDLLADLITSMKGKKCSLDDLKNTAKETLIKEKRFNERAGFNSGDDVLPEFFYLETNPASGTVFDVPKEEMDEVHKYD